MWEEFCSLSNVVVDIYYCIETEYDRKWSFQKAQNCKETFLKGVSIGGKFHNKFKYSTLYY